MIERTYSKGALFFWLVARSASFFDCDGTLIDSMGAWRELEADLARRVGAELDKEDTDALTTMSIPECGAYLHGKFGLGESPEEVVGTIDDFMMDYYANRSVARPGALRFVRGLRMPACRWRWHLRRRARFCARASELCGVRAVHARRRIGGRCGEAEAGACRLRSGT